MPTRKWGSEKLVNTTTAGNQFASDVAALTGGGFVVVWEDESAGADAAIRAQRYDAAGSRVGGEMLIQPSAATNDMDSPSVTGLAGGGFYVTWTQNVGPDNYIQGRVYNASGGFVREQTVVFAFGLDTSENVARLGTGSVVAWTEPDTTDGDILFRIFDAAGNGSGLLVANTSTAARQDFSDVAATPDGQNFIIAWQDYVSGSTEIKARIFNSAGAAIEAEFEIPNDDFGAEFGVTVAWLSNSRFVAAWVDLNGSQQTIMARIFNSAGQALSNDILVNSTMEGVHHSAGITALPNGGFVVSWVDFSGVGLDDGASIRLQAFDGAGGKIGGEIIVNTTTVGSQLEPSITALADGRVAVSWTDLSATGGDLSGRAVRMQIVDPRDGIVTGTPASEILYGHDLVNDEISAGAGNDTLFGLEGNDALYGGAGIDTLVGGLGGDHMFGGVGSDIAIIDSALDRVFEDAASGTDQVITPISYQLQAGSRVEILKTDNTSGTTALNLTGNEFANTLQGNNGANKLNGGLGNDTMDGKGGNDTYIVANSSDRVLEGLNGGTDTILALLNHTLQAGSRVEIIKTINSAATTAINLIGNEFGQRIEGNAGSNVLTGNGGNDTLQGLGGNDTLAAGTGNDTMTGGSGNDTFFFNTALSSVSNVERVTDYSVVSDTMRLENAVFTGLATGTLSAAAFRVGAAAADASDRIIYNNATGAVSFDSDGTGATAAIKFAQLAAGLAMTNAEFQVV